MADGTTAPLVVRRDRAVLRVWGRDPVRMIDGLATADIGAVTADRSAYTAFLTPKGRMVADARVLLRPASGQPPELLLTTDPDALPALVEHLRKFIPPLFARFEDVTAEHAVVGVFGDGASSSATAGIGAAAAPEATGGVEAFVLSPAAEEGAVVVVSADPLALAVRVAETGGDGWELLVGVERADAVVAAAERAGARRGTEADLEPLRIAAGRPRWGAELTPDVIPLEAGLERAISQTKGCYTGQEVIIRILHRGHVNRHLRALTFEGGAPAPGTELFEPGVEKPRGVVTSATEAQTPAIGLGYVRREVAPPAELRVGAPDGPAARVTALT